MAFVKAAINCKPTFDSASLVGTQIDTEHQHPPVHVTTTSNQLIQAAEEPRERGLIRGCLWRGAASSPRRFGRGSLGKGWASPGSGACPALPPAGAQRQPRTGLRARGRPLRAQGTPPLRAQPEGAGRRRALPARASARRLGAAQVAPPPPPPSPAPPHEGDGGGRGRPGAGKRKRGDALERRQRRAGSRTLTFHRGTAHKTKHHPPPPCAAP